jgi:hypothetical protein
MMDKPIFLDALKDLNERYPISDLVKMFRTLGFCKMIISSRAEFRKLEYRMGNITSMMSNPDFVARFLCQDFMVNVSWICGVFGTSNAARMLACPKLCERIAHRAQIHKFVEMFGVCETAKLFSSDQFYENSQYDPIPLVQKFGKVGASKLLRKSPHLQHVDQVLSLLGSSYIARQVLCTKWFIMNTEAIQTLVSWVGSQRATSLLLQEYFVVRMSDCCFLRHFRLLLDAGINSHHVTADMCIHMEKLEFVDRLCTLLHSVGPDIVSLIVRSPHFSEPALAYVCELAKSLTYSESALIFGSAVLRDRLLAQFIPIESQ